MLTTLRIKNLALVADLTLELQPGCNVITGETGAGKSIIIGALNLVLGERADRELIRTGEDNCSVEAMFDVKELRAPLKQFLDENGLEPCEDSQLVLKRAFTANGTNRQFVNGSPTTLNTLAAIGEWLVDIHGPHDHQSLLHPARQLAILDAFGGLEKERDAFGELVRCRGALEGEKSALIVDEKTYVQQLDLLRFQVQEITAARLKPDEEAEVEQAHRRAGNAAKLLQLSQAALETLAENENALLTQAGVIGRTLQELQRVDAGTANLVELHSQAAGSWRELQAGLSRYVEKVDVDPARLAELEERLNLIHSLKRKYGASLAEVIAFGDEAKRKLQSLESRDAELDRLNAGLAKLDAEILKAGQSLSARRRKIIPQLAKSVGKQLADLGFRQSKFGVELKALTPSSATGKGPFEDYPFPPHPDPLLKGEGTAGVRPGFGDDRGVKSDVSNSASWRTIPPLLGERAGVRGLICHTTGFDEIEFQFAPNPGEPAKPLRAIASSGEMARVMLALKTVLAAEDEIPVLIFDEVDANVGGETARPGATTSGEPTSPSPAPARPAPSSRQHELTISNFNCIGNVIKLASCQVLARNIQETLLSKMKA